jgi:hypothetical protein
MENNDSKSWLDDSEKRALLGLTIEFEQRTIQIGALTSELGSFE